jgi:broad specificity phosphatase PhoE
MTDEQLKEANELNKTIERYSELLGRIQRAKEHVAHESKQHSPFCVIVLGHWVDITTKASVSALLKFLNKVEKDTIAQRDLSIKELEKI